MALYDGNGCLMDSRPLINVNKFQVTVTGITNGSLYEMTSEWALLEIKEIRFFLVSGDNLIFIGLSLTPKDAENFFSQLHNDERFVVIAYNSKNEPIRYRIKG